VSVDQLEAAAAFVLAMLGPAAARRWNGSWFAPAAVVLGAWGLTYGLAAMRLLPYRDVAPDTRLFIVAAVALLVIGTQVGQFAVSRVRAARGPAAATSLPSWWVTGFALCGLLGTIWYVYEVSATMGWGAFADGGRLREALSAGVVSSRFLVLQLGAIVAPLLALSIRLQGGRLGAVPFALALAAGSLTLLSTDRTQFFLLFMTAAFMAAVRVERTVRPARIAAAAAIAAGVLVVAFLVIGAWTKKAPGDLQLELRWPPTGAGEGSGRPLPAAAQPFAVLYAYATCSYPALDILLGRVPAYTGGVHTAYPVVRALQRAGLYDGPVPEAIAPFVTLVEEPGRPPVLFNTYTFLYYPLEDFGRGGALAYAFAVGLIAGAVFGAFRRRPDGPVYLMATAHVATALALTTFVNKFNNSIWWYVVVATTVPWLLATAPWLRRLGRPAPR
jgi:hypothetical protein